jgi:glycosyltransferase involved in cell wall biosynthesis
MAPIYRPMDLKVTPEFNFHKPLRLGFFGQYRKEKNLDFLLSAFVKAKFTQPVHFTVQGATVTVADSDDFERLANKYSQYKNITFWHKNLLGIEWQKALMDCDIILMPYGAERYRYQPSAMLFTAIGYFKPVLQSPEMNPQVLNEFKVGQAVKLDSVDSFSQQLEEFINNFEEQADEYRQGLIGANKKYGQDRLIKTIVKILS